MDEKFIAKMKAAIKTLLKPVGEKVYFAGEHVPPDEKSLVGVLHLLTAIVCLELWSLILFGLTGIHSRCRCVRENGRHEDSL